MNTVTSSTVEFLTYLPLANKCKMIGKRGLYSNTPHSGVLVVYFRFDGTVQCHVLVLVI